MKQFAEQGGSIAVSLRGLAGTWILRAFLFGCLSSAAFGRIVTVSTATQFKAAIAALQPGDTVDALDGTYDLNTYLSITVSGTESQPILIRAHNRGGVTFINKSFFNPKRVNYLTIEGFIFSCKDGTAIKLESCNYCRITRNIFRLVETVALKWIIIQDIYNATAPSSGNNRIDHNLFENKSLAGNMITIDGFQGTPTQSSRNDRIDHNHFRNVGPRIDNGMETIRIGVSTLAKTNSYTIVEYNLFEDCDGDPEYVSVKTDSNVIRYNTFRSCQGTLCLRQTRYTTVEGNFFFGNGKTGTGGIRILKNDNRIINNYLTGLAGSVFDAALVMMNGDADSNSSDQSLHFRPVRNIVAFNTLVNNDYNIEIGYTHSGGYSLPPKDNVIANNIVLGSKNQLVKVYTTPLNHTWLGNIFFPTGTATLGITAAYNQIKVIDPCLELRDSLWRLTSVSPAIDSGAGMYTYIVSDIDGQARSGVQDVGSDEFSAARIVNRPLSANDVGPDAVDPSGNSGYYTIKVIPQGFFIPAINRLSMSDTATAFLANVTAPFAFIDSARMILDSVTLTGQTEFSRAENGNYYLVVKHRNSIETWSRAGGEAYLKGKAQYYDFTDAAVKAYGNNLAQSGSKFCLYSGDVNQDGIVDFTDLSMVDNAQYNFLSGYVATDITGDQFVDFSDLSLADNNSFAFVSTISPRSLKQRK